MRTALWEVVPQNPDSKQKRHATLNTALIVIVTFLPSVSRSIFSLWDCVQYESAPGETVGFMRKDPSVQCGSDEHSTTKALGGALIMLWPVGMVMLFVGLLVYNREELRAGEARTTSAKAVRFLTSGFKDKYFYWEIVELVRRLLVSGWLLLIPYDRMFFRLLFAHLISLILLVLTAIAQPWSRPGAMPPCKRAT